MYDALFALLGRELKVRGRVEYVRGGHEGQKDEVLGVGAERVGDNVRLEANLSVEV